MTKDRDQGNWPDPPGTDPKPTQASQVQVPPPAGPARPAWRSGGPEGNERLAAMTGAVLLILLAVEGYTILRIGRLLTLHKLRHLNNPLEFINVTIAATSTSRTIRDL